MAALLSALIWIVFLPVWLVVVIPYTLHRIFSSRKLGISATALNPMSMRWMQHQLGLRRDDGCAKLIKVLPNHSYAGLYAATFPVLLGHRLTGFVPKMLRYPYEGIPPVQHETALRATFVDAAIERYLPGVEQFVELGAGYDTRTVQLQHNQRIRCFEVEMPKTQQIKRELLHRCGVDTSGVKFVPANFLTDNWLDNLVKAGFDPAKAHFLSLGGCDVLPEPQGDGRNLSDHCHECARQCGGVRLRHRCEHQDACKPSVAFKSHFESSP